MRSVRRDGARLALETSRGLVTSSTLVVATGEYGVPREPEWAGRFAGPVTHSRRFDPSVVTAGDTVVVVGAGNSGADAVRLCLARGASVVLSAAGPLTRPPRAPPRVVREALFWLSGLPIARVPGRGGCTDSTPVVDVDLFDAIDAGRVRLVSRTVDLAPTGVVTAREGLVPADRVVLCTGFRRETAWLSLLVDVDPATGLPAQRGGVASRDLAIGFVGVPCMRTRRSGFIRGFSDDAAVVVRALASRA